MRLENKVAIITGGASGFGKGIVNKFINEGAKVLIADINYESAKELEEKLGKNASALKVDVTKTLDVENMIKEVISRFSKVDILIQNAAIGMKPRPLVESSEDLFDKLFDTNVKSIYLGAKNIIPQFISQNIGGCIVNVVSTAAIRPRPGLTLYNATKGALIPLTKALALEVAEHKIRVNGICPVAGETPMLKDFLGDDDPDNAYKKFKSTVPLGRLAEPKDVANACLFLSSEEASFITGVMLEVDGGRTI
ncbi:MAG: 4-formylbenzenesulfonate dehydrogenase TsaC1/TsaC2 [Alphaproteobacteria bacterium MarineAlpha9_Bin4]|nr:3-oxoacyl-ACP reductase [Pelagibacterales bacterium]PPR27481.1 MAG: 4-formylbenzenesulfonate dehydrogenase TsaC1/TsaC2 [Alphaproteobacteria bacterium MarineAlpha9_Bin4]